ncbi:Abi family protein [Luteococcus sp.]|uniref:Abi family protein n=1 Tax=Luteococcus sp. TaxID=1969402 RepID=UPI003736C933
MAEYTKPWLSIDAQIDQVAARGLTVGERTHATYTVRGIGYYRLTGYLYPFRESETSEADGRICVRVLDSYQPGTTLRHAEEIISFDRRLRMLVMDGIERIEIATRMHMGYVLGRRSPFAYEDPRSFTDAFTTPCTDARNPAASKHVQWLQQVNARKAKSDEQFVAHFRECYDDRMPIWALTEVLELGHLSTLYRGMLQPDAEEVAAAFDVPTKKLMSSWLASLNYVRNVSAHHARLFNRKLQNAPKRPRKGSISDLDHLSDQSNPKPEFGTYNALAVIAYLLRGIDPACDWAPRMTELLHEFPTSHALTLHSIGVPDGWDELPLWKP